MPKNFPSNLQIKFIESHRIKSIKMQFDCEGALIFKKSKRISMEQCLEFLKKNMEWVLTHFQAMQEIVFFEDKMYCFGEWQEFNAVCLELEKAGLMDKFLKVAKVQCKSIQEYLQCLWVGVLAQERECKKILALLYEELLKAYIKERLEEITQAMDLRPNVVVYGKSYRQLGCCYANTQKIRFSLRLSLMPKECIDSVIIHELAHLKHQNHSKEFWSLVEAFDDNPKRLQLWLNQHKENMRIYYKVFKH